MDKYISRAEKLELANQYFSVNNERWITIKPHGEDSDDYRRLKLEDGETPKEAIDRVYKKKDKKETEPKEVEKKQTIQERVAEKQKELDKVSQEYTKVYEEVNKFESKVYELLDGVDDVEKRNEIFKKFREEHKDEEEKLAKKRNDAYAKYEEADKSFTQYKNKLAEEVLGVNFDKFNQEALKEHLYSLKDVLFLSGIELDKRKALRDKIDDANLKLSRFSVKERADKIGGYTKKLNDLCGFTEFSDISSYPEELQKHIYDNYKTVYSKYPQIKYGGIGKYKLGKTTYAQNASISNRITLNSTKYDNLEELKKSYSKCVESGFHPQGTDYNSIITHELGHGLQQYIEKKHNISAKDIRAKVLKKLGIKQKDVKAHLSEYAMAKPREAHEFFAEAFAEYMTSKNPRPLALEFGKEIDRILNNN